MPKALPLDDCPAVKVFREVERILRASADLAAVIDDRAWRTWDGTYNTDTPLPDQLRAAIRLSPNIAADDWWSPDSVSEPLQINVDIQIRSRCIDDVLNLWQAVKRAIYPPDDPTLDPTGKPRFDLIARLQAAGAQTGIAKFTGPTVAADSSEAPMTFLARGIIAMEVSNPLNL